MKKDRRYQSYLLRLWQTRDDEIQIWRASLESAATREYHGFASMEDLCAFLRAQTGETDPSGVRRQDDEHDGEGKGGERKASHPLGP